MSLVKLTIKRGQVLAIVTAEGRFVALFKGRTVAEVLEQIKGGKSE